VGGVENTSANKIKQSILTITGNILPESMSQRLSDSMVHTPVTRQCSNGGFHRLQKHRRAVRILLSNVLAVLLMWLPITVVMFLIYVDGHRNDDHFFLTNQYFIWSVIIALMNTIVNPILYGFLTENFKDYYPWRRWLRKCCCLKWIESSVVTSNPNISSSRNASVLNFGDDNTVVIM
jgi:7 transmembrane receptor (rhodopsin family)